MSVVVEKSKVAVSRGSLATVLPVVQLTATPIASASAMCSTKGPDFFKLCPYMKTTTLPLRNLINCSPLRAFLLIPFVLACFALSPQARAVCQEGCLTDQNTVLGDNALLNNTGIGNTAIGDDALFSNTVGFSNTAIGHLALADNIMGNFNTATGTGALNFNTTGSDNTANGDGALESNTTGQQNTATGRFALLLNSVGNFNTATGFGALFNNEDSNNTATGVFALKSNRTGNNNTATGVNALFNNHTGSNNTAIGDSALLNNKHGSKNIALGSNAGRNLVVGNDNIYIGSHGMERESNAIHIGINGTQTTTFIAGISGTTVAGGVGVIVDANGQLGTVVSSARFKDAIKPMDKASEAILALKPVTFHYKQEIDPEGIPQFGLVAEEVEKVNPDLVARDADGKAYTVRYEAVNAMLLNEFLKGHHQVQDLKAIVAEQQKQIEALTAGLQKVSRQAEMSRPAAQMVLNNQ
jgi:hypothetical protein